MVICYSSNWKLTQNLKKSVNKICFYDIFLKIWVLGGFLIYCISVLIKYFIRRISNGQRIIMPSQQFQR